MLAHSHGKGKVVSLAYKAAGHAAAATERPLRRRPTEGFRQAG